MCIEFFFLYEYKNVGYERIIYVRVYVYIYDIY